MLHESGMVTPDDLDEVTLRLQDSMSCCLGLETLRKYRSDGPPLRMIDRSGLDPLLAAMAVRAGARLRCGVRVASVTPEGITTMSGEEVRAPVVVAADGADGRAARSIRGRHGNPRGVGFEVFLPMPAGFQEHIGIHFGMASYGYAWVFPRRDDVCLGVGSCTNRTSTREMIGGLRALVAGLGLCWPGPGALRAAPLPSGRPDGALGRGMRYLVGDAAGMVDQMTGEGLSHAIESGLLAADAVLQGWTRREIYRRTARGCAGIVRQSSRARHLVYSPLLRGRAMRRLREDEKFFRGYWDLVSGDTDYAGMLRGFLRRGPSRPASPRSCGRSGEQ